jgi:two-component system KDP operon response regulator KdpE
LAIGADFRIQRLLKAGMATEKIDVTYALTAEEGLSLLSRKPLDAIILDLELTDRNAWDVLREIRAAYHLPVVVLSSRDDVRSTVLALDLGADDYLVKPPSVAALAARLRVAWRHRFQARGVAPTSRFGEVVIDFVNRRITRAGVDVALSRTEYEILRLLAESPGKALTHDHILREVRGDDNAGDPQYLRVYVRALRMKLGDGLIQTETGFGYRLIAEEAAA